MLSKEEIEDLLKDMNEYFREAPKRLNNTYPLDPYQYQLLKEYIKQLERKNKILTHTNKTYKGIINKQNKDKQKLIEKLEEDIENDFTIREHIVSNGVTLATRTTHVDTYATEILSILKGENDE